jgi:cell wall-associated NlpC family hydrolase
MPVNRRLLDAIRTTTSDPVAREALLTTAMIESGGDLVNDVGDAGRSIGPYQEHEAGRGAGLSVEQRNDPVASTQRAWSEFSRLRRPGESPGEWAYRSQRPADRAGYIQKFNAALPQARTLLSQGFGGPEVAGNAAQQAGQAVRSAPAVQAPRQQLAMSLLNRSDEATDSPGQSLLMAATRMAQQARPATGEAPAAPQDGAGAAQGAADAAGATAAPATVQWARSQMGVPYSWGGGNSQTGTPTKGIAQGANTVGWDCSGLTQAAWLKQGIDVGPTTYQQIHAGVAVPSIEQAQPGDLLFPSEGHVQMYVGNGQVIEAPQTGGHVQVVSVRPSYIAIRRPG